jgi:hypothetical protein
MGITTKDFILRLSVVIIAAISPFIYILSVGELPSISSYWESSMQPMFIFVNASTSYFLFSLNKWKISAIFLLLLTAFSFEMYFVAHHVFAIAFFLFNLYPIILNKKTRWLIFPYLASGIFIFYSILYAEIFAIVVLCYLHLNNLIRYWKLSKEKKLRSYTA